MCTALCGAACYYAKNNNFYIVIETIPMTWRKEYKKKAKSNVIYNTQMSVIIAVIVRSTTQKSLVFHGIISKKESRCYNSEKT